MSRTGQMRRDRHVNVSFLQELLNTIAEQGRQLLPRSLGGADPHRRHRASWPTRWFRCAARPPAWPSRARSSTATARLTPEERHAFLKFLAETLQPDPNGATRAAKAYLEHPSESAMSRRCRPPSKARARNFSAA